jgi:Domain of unknown function (DUF4190)/Septum formation
VGLRFNPPPNWPPPPPGFVPPPRWQPDPSWPPPPPGWQVWVDDSLPGDQADFVGGPRDGSAGRPGDGFAGGRGGSFADGPGDFAGQAPTAVAAPGPPPRDRQDHPYDPFSGRKTNGFAIAAFVLGMIGGTILSLTLAIVALRQIRETGQRGKGLAITGLVFSVIWGAVLVGYLFVYNPGPSVQRPASAGSSPSSSLSSSPAASPSASHSGSSGSAGSHSHSGSTTQTANVFVLRTGQCFQNPPSSQSVLGITSVTVVPCTTPHNAQVVAEFPATGTSYPGTTVLRSQADKGCHARLSGQVVNSKITDTMTLRYLYPLVTSWASGHRTISCLVVDAKPDLKSSLLR